METTKPDEAVQGLALPGAVVEKRYRPHAEPACPHAWERSSDRAA